MNPSKKLTIQECEVDNNSVIITKKEYTTCHNGRVRYSFQRVEHQVVAQSQLPSNNLENITLSIEDSNTSSTIDNCVGALELAQERIHKTRLSNQNFVRKDVSQVRSRTENTSKSNYDVTSKVDADYECGKNRDSKLDITNNSDSAEIEQDPNELLALESSTVDTNPSYMDPADIIEQYLQTQPVEPVSKPNSHYSDIPLNSQFVTENCQNLEKSFSNPDSYLESSEAKIDMATKKSNNTQHDEQAELDSTELEVETADLKKSEPTSEQPVDDKITIENNEIIIETPVVEAEESQEVEPEPTPLELFVAKLNARGNLRNVIEALEELKTNINNGLDLTQPQNSEYIQALTTFIREVVAVNQDVLTFDNAKKQETISRVKLLIDERRKVIERLTREYDSAKQYANEKPVKDVVKPLFQNFSTALSRFPKNEITEEFETFKTKLLSFEEQLRADLAKFGIIIFGQAGDAFDPTRHDAVAQYPAQTPEQANTLAYVSAQGYELNGRVVSPATVITYGDFED